jgi:antitoxin (DNA-binding transcriptional repressor) of toxin-antitoxin stability system
MRTIPAGKFKATCLALMDEVQRTGEIIQVTKRGKLVGQYCPIPEEPKEAPESIFGCMRGMITINEDFDKPLYTDEEWEEMFNQKWARYEEKK